MTMKKEMLERIKECMQNPERIRNVATSSHVHHGKCVSGETLIFLENGPITAKELFKIAKKEGILERKGLEEVYKFKKPLSVLTYNNGVISRGMLTHAWKIENSDELIEVETKDGRRVRVTPEHKFLIFENGSVKEREARLLEKGDLLVLPASLPLTSFDLNNLKSLFLEKLSKDYSFLIYLKKKIKKEIHKKIVEYVISNV